MLISPDKKGTVDATTYRIIKDIPADIPIVPITRLPDFEYNPMLESLKKYVLVDYCELGANDWDRKETHLFGRNTITFKDRFKGTEWAKFDKFVKNNPPTVYFKRELLKKDFSGNVHPIEYPAFNPKYPIQDKKEFDKRPIAAFHCWGWSHESRRVLHGEIFVNAAIKGYCIIDNFNHFDNGLKDYSENKNIWATINVPHFARIPIEQVLYINGLAKLSVSLPGAGVKCFRHSESPVNSIMVMQEDNLAWAYPWEHGLNCIKVKTGEDIMSIRGLSSCPEIEVIEDALKRDDLYDIYVNGVEHLDKYRLPRYINEYIKPTIEKYANG